MISLRGNIITFKNRLALVVIAIAILIYLVKNFDFLGVDLTITQSIQNFHFSWFVSLMKLVSQLGSALFGSLIAISFALLLLFFRKFRSASLLLVSSFGAELLSRIIKELIQRPRPDPKLINVIGSYTKTDSFPSGHVLFAVGLYGFLFFLSFIDLKKHPHLRKVVIGISLLVLSLMGMSRIYLGAHWFSDVLGAYLIGYLWLLLVIHFYHLTQTGQKDN